MKDPPRHDAPLRRALPEHALTVRKRFGQPEFGLEFMLMLDVSPPATGHGALCWSNAHSKGSIRDGSAYKVPPP